MSVTDSLEYSIFDLTKYGKIGLKIKKEGETSTTLIPDPILVEEEPIDESSTTYNYSFERIKSLKESIRLIKEIIMPITEGLTSFTESVKPITEGLTSFTESVKPIAELLISLEPIINLKKYDFFKLEIENRLMNFREDRDDKFIYKKENLMIIRKFLLDLRDLYLEKYDFNIEPPYIIPGPAHSIDVHWITNQYRLLINFPVDISEEITVTGHKKRRDVIKLSTNPNNTVKLILPWLNMVMKKKTL